MKLIILADDLTGAMDAAAPFARRGAVVDLIPTPDLPVPPPEDRSAVLAINLDWRHLSAEAAAERIQSAKRALGTGSRMFLKIDSTLRGPVAAAIRATAEPGQAVVLAPAVPEEGRTVRDGRVLVGGAPLEQSDLMNDPRSPPFTGDLRAVLAPLPVRMPDADDRAALDRIASTAPPDALWVGAAGLAAALAVLGDGQVKVRSGFDEGGRVIFVIGSAHPRAGAQIKALEDAGFGPVLLARPPRRTNALTIPAALAARAMSVIDARQPDVVVASGGETALALIRALGVGNLQVLGQPTPGICAARLSYAGRSLLLVTKAGGFGGKAVFVDLVYKLGLQVAV